MSKIEMIYTIGLAIVALIVLVYYFVLMIKNGWIKKITMTLNDAIRYAEKNITGKAEKKNYVLSKVEEKCAELGIPYVLIRNLVSKTIERIIGNYNIIDHDGK